MSSGGPPHHSHNRQVPNANAAAAWNHLQAQLQKKKKSSEMSSGGPPHHSHNRQVPNANAAAAWNHLQAQLQVPNYFPRQPQAAHTHPMPTSDHTMHPTWHTPTTTDAMKMLPNMQHSHLLNEMLKQQEGLFRGREGVDLSLTRNGNQNGELPSNTHPISLSVRDTNKINSLSGLDIQAVNSPSIKSTVSPSLTITPSVTVSPGLKSVSPGLKAASPGIKSGSPGIKTGSPSHKPHSPAPNSGSPGLGGLLGMGNMSNLPASLAMAMDPGKNQKRSNVRVDSILERLNPASEKPIPSQEHKHQEHPGLQMRPDLHITTATRPDMPNKGPDVLQYAMARKQAEMLANLQGGLGPESLNPAALANMQRFLEMAMSKNVMPDLSHVLRTDLAQLKHDAAPNVSKEPTTASSYTNVPLASSLASDRSNALEKQRVNVDKKVLEKERKEPEKTEKGGQQSSVIVQAAASFDENSNSSSTANAPTPVKEDDSGSMHSNEDSLDSTKSRRKRKPSKTIKVLAKEEEEQKSEKNKVTLESTPRDEPSSLTDNKRISVSSILEGKSSGVSPSSKIPERRRSSDDLDALISPTKIRRKTSSESETIDNIAAMVQEGLREKGTSGDRMLFHRGTIQNPKDESRLKLPSNVTLGSNQLPVSDIKPKEASSDSTKDEVDGIKKMEKKEENTALKNEPTEVIKEAARETSRSSPVMTPAQKKASITHFVEVENKLEEMFAGIVGEPSTQPSTSSLNGDSLKSDLLGHSDVDLSVKREENEDISKAEAGSDSDRKEERNSVPKKGKRSRARSRLNNDEEETGSKKGRFSRVKPANAKTRKPSKSPLTVTASPSTSKAKRLPGQSTSTPPGGGGGIKANAKTFETRDVYAYDSGSNASSSRSRGPFVQIKGHRDSPVSVSIVNTPLNVDEDGDKKPLKSKKFHDDSEYRHKVRSKGLHCSTLSNKYDAQTKDATWICAFCKRGPHASELTGPSVNTGETATPPQGDLFGPYFITTQCPEFERRLDDPYDRHFKSKKIGKILDGAAASPAAGKSKTKSKRKHSESSLDPTDIYLGITSTTQDSYEVWAHEDCLVWSQGVYLVGPKIVGLEEAVWSSCNVGCSVCGLKGANISCIKRGCLTITHLCCARGSGWQFDEDQFKAYCPQHSLL